jgi:hypothetical protein
MKETLRYCPMAIAALIVSIFFGLGVMSCFRNLPIGLVGFLAIPVFVICMNGMDKPFRDVPRNR